MEPNFPISGSLNLHSPYFLIYLKIGDPTLFFGNLHIGFLAFFPHLNLKLEPYYVLMCLFFIYKGL